MLAREDAPTIRLRDVTRAEITKALTNPAVPRAAAAAAAVNTALFALAAGGVVRVARGGGLLRLSDLGAVLFAPVYLFLLVPILVAGSEYASGQYRVALSAVPDRGRLVVSKLAALGAVVVPAAVVAVLPGRLIVSVTNDLPAGSVALDLVRWIAAYVLMSCVAYGLATLLRSQIAPLAILALVPLLLATGVLPYPAVIRLLPDQLSLSLLGTPGFDITALPPGAAAALLALWAGVLLAAQAVAVQRRDS